MTRQDGRNYTDKQAEVIAKSEAEEQYGHYRSTKAQGQGMKAMIESIHAFCINYWTMQKHQVQAAENID